VSGTDYLKEAVAACRAALTGYNRERTPAVWAQAQHNLGNALMMLGKRESGAELLKEAVAAFNVGLEAGHPQVRANRVGTPAA
jgi:hypothetical protein